VGILCTFLKIIEILLSLHNIMGLQEEKHFKNKFQGCIETKYFFLAQIKTAAAH